MRDGLSLNANSPDRTLTYSCLDYRLGSTTDLLLAEIIVETHANPTPLQSKAIVTATSTWIRVVSK